MSEPTRPSIQPGTVQAADVAQTPSRWPRALGIVALVYAIVGLTCLWLGVAWLIFMGPLMSAMAGIKAEVPAMLKWSTLVTSSLVMLNAVLLIVGSVRLQRRHPRSVALLQRWVVIRLVLLVIGVTIAVLLIPQQIEMQREIQEQVNDMLERNNQPRQVINEDTLRIQVISGVAMGAIVPAIFPMFLGFYLVRKRVVEEVQHWDVESVI